MIPRRPSVPYEELLPTLPTVLYRCYDDEGELLYIGIGHDLERRVREQTKQHEHDDEAWIHWVAEVEVEQFPDRRSALQAEKAVIAAEFPRYNRTGKAVLKRPRVRGGVLWRGWRAEARSEPQKCQ